MTYFKLDVYMNLNKNFLMILTSDSYAVVSSCFLVFAYCVGSVLWDFLLFHALVFMSCVFWLVHCVVLSCIVSLPCLVSCLLSFSCLVQSCLVLSCYVESCVLFPYLVLSFRVLSFMS